MDFFERVKQLARSNKVTIESVANKAGLSIDSYNSYKRHGNLPRADEAVAIAEALNTTVEYLVTGKEPEIAPDTSEILDTIQKLENQVRAL